MKNDLREQASQLYKSKREALPTSDSLSIKKLVYIALGLLVVVLALIQALGGFQSRTNPILAASTPPAIVMEDLPEEDVGAPGAAKVSESVPSQTGPSWESRTETLPPIAPKTKSIEPPPPPRRKQASTAKKTTQLGAAQRPTLTRQKRPRSNRPEVTVSEPDVSEPAPPEEPEITAIEQAQREQAREVVVQQVPSLASLLTESASDYKGWNAEPMGPEDYQVTFSFSEAGSDSTIKYIWKVNLPKRTITPLSYYARKLR